MNYELNHKIIQFYNIYRKNHSFNVDSYFVALINSYAKNHLRLIYFTIDLHYKQILHIATKIAHLRLKNYILLNNHESIKDIKLQIKRLEEIHLETDKNYAECNSIDKCYITQITQINETNKKECYVCYETTLLYNFYECKHFICDNCYHKIKNKSCPLCKSIHIEHQSRGLPHNHNCKIQL
jgi:hypothetical protein